MEKELIIFDDCCNLCSSSVQFVLKRDPGDHFRFVSSQSDRGRQILEQCGIEPERLETVVLIKGKKCLTGSDAVLGIAQKLNGIWPAFSILRFVPRSLRDRLYGVLVRNRYHFFGKSDKCLLLPKKDAGRFLY